MKKRILILDNVHPIIPETLIQNEYIVEDGTLKNRGQLIDCIANYQGIVLRSRITIDKEIIDKATNLKFIARVGAGMESIDVEYCRKQGVECLNSPEGNRDAVGEHATGMLLSLLNNLNKADSEVKRGVWNREENRGGELGALTVGIIGYGNMGSAFAKKLSGFGCKVIAYDKYKIDYSDSFGTEVSLENLHHESDVISLHVPLTEETKYMINESFIEKLSKQIILLNTARGPVVKTSALVNALKNNKIVAAGLDVIEYEESSFETTKAMTDELDFKYLASCKNVILTPHIAGWTVESKIKLAQVLVDKILKVEL